MKVCPPLPAEDLAHILEHTRPLWEEVRSEKIFITGGTGFFGSWLLESFVHANLELGLDAQAVVLSRRPEAFLAKFPHLAHRPDLHFWKGDVLDFAFPPGTFPFVIHAATEASAKLNDEAPHEMFSTIADGTRHLLNFAAQAGTKKLLLTSSGAVYGAQPSQLTHVPEDDRGGPDPLNPASAYGEGKRVSEHLCTLAARHFGFELKIARCFAFVGPHLPLDTHFAIGNFIRDALAGGPIRVGGDGTPFRSYLYAADLAIWLWTILFRGTAGRAYNVGSAHDLPIAAIAEAVKAALDIKDDVQIARVPEPGRDASRYVPCVQRAALELGLRETCDLTSAIQRTASWHRSQQ